VCGICGIVAAPGDRPSLAFVERMCEVLVHRGPDDSGTVVQGQAALGMRRLSIIDLAGGHQPLANDDETVWVVFNGEIYNHPELREELTAAGRRFRTRSDTEVLLRAYEHWGDRCVDHLNGMFAFAVLDGPRNALLLARDRIGIKPLYYATANRRLVFASELKALLLDPSVRGDVDLSSLDEYLALEFVPSPRSMVEGVSKLQPGHTLVWDLAEGRASVARYWDVDLAQSESDRDRRTVEELVAGLRGTLHEAVRKELVSDVPLGVFLSGGLDSSAVASAMTDIVPGTVKSFSIGFTDPSFDESRHARTVAQHLGTDHHELILEPGMMTDLVPAVMSSLDEPLGDASVIPTYLLSRFTREHVTVALSGDGGDELFAGYPTLQAHRAAALYNRLPGVLRARVLAPLAHRLPVSPDNISLDFKAKRFVDGAPYPLGERHARWMGSFAPEERAALLTADARRAIAEGDEADALTTHLNGLALEQPLNKVLYLDMKLYLEGDILVKTDRASMMNSLEARVPLLNAGMVDFVTALPLSMKLRGLRSKYLLRRAMDGVLPPATLKRPKKGFGIPVARWLKGELRAPLLDALSPAKIEREGFFDHRVVSRLVDEHLDGRRDNRKQLWTLFVFERWLETSARSPA